MTVITACGFQSSASTEQPDAAIGADGPDGVMHMNDNVVHVGSGDEYIGMGDLTIAAPITIDTGRMSFGMVLPPDVTFTPAKQDGGGLDLAILHVRKLDVHATVRVVGPRPLVVIAHSFELTQTINVTPPCNAPPSPSPASAVGSGAIELYARTWILISGYINTGVISGTGVNGGLGGGGAPGGDGCPEDALAGSDGSIILQSPLIENSGRLSASGGGGTSANGGSSPGQILMLYKTQASAGVTTPTAIKQPY